MTDREKAIITAYTGITMLTGDKLSIFHKYIEDIMGRPIWTHELANPNVWDEIKEKSRDDFLRLCAEAENQNDLISREALKEAINTYDKFACLPSGKLEPFRNLEHSEMFEPYVHLRDIRNAIDNAPTVDVKDEIAGAYNEGYMCGSREAEKARPQGEWILQTYERFNSGNELYKYDCNKCGHREEHAYSDSKLPNFCPNCGARMRKERKK